jgi:hypothetical protein
MGFVIRLVVSAVFFLAAHTARSAEISDYEVGTGLFCDTAQQVERFVNLFDGDDTATAVAAVNEEEHNPGACSLATVAFVRGNQAGTTHRKDTAYQIIHVLVVGVETKQGLRPITPTAYFTVFSVKEFAI